MAVFRCYFLPENSPELQEHSIEPAVEFAKRWLIENRPTNHVAVVGNIKSLRVQGPAVLVEQETHRVWFSRIGQEIGTWHDVTAEFAGVLKQLL